MADDFSDKVRALLEDPEMLAKIVSIAGSLGVGGQQAPAASPAPQTTIPQPPATQTIAEQQAPADIPTVPNVPSAPKLPQIPSLPAVPKADPRVALLNSIKPFLRAERQAKVDTLTRALTVANLFGTMKKKQ